MTVDSIGPEFSLWPSLAVSEADVAVGQVSNGFSGFFGRMNDASPFSRVADQSPGVPLELQALTDQLFHSADAASAAELLAALQQQQQLQSAEEHTIDAQIERLLHMKQALHRQKQQAQHLPILEHEPLLMVRSSASTLAGQSSATSVSMQATCAPIPSELPLDSSLMGAMPCTSMDLNQDWAWATRAAAACAAQQQNRHSIDLGGLAHRLGAMDMGTTHNSFCQQQSVVAASAAAAAASAAAAAAALVTTQAPFSGGAFAPPPAAHRQSIDLLAARQSIDLRQSVDLRQSIDLRGAGRPSIDMRTVAASRRPSYDMRLVSRQSVDMPATTLSAANLALQSALYMPTATTAMEPTLQTAIPQPVVQTALGLGGQVPRVPTGRTSVDITASSSLYHSTAPPLGSGLQQQQQAAALAGQQASAAAWLAGSSSAARACARINTHQRASIDVPTSRTPDVRCPPRKSCSYTSSISSSSARNSPIGGNGRQQPIHQAPKWAGSHWHPMAEAVKNGQLQNKGTGVFIPPGMKLAEDQKTSESAEADAS